MLHDPARHEPLIDRPWCADTAAACIQRIVDGLEDAFVEGSGWPMHALDRGEGEPATPNPSLYFGATGVIWALMHLHSVGAARPRRTAWLDAGQLVEATRRWLGDAAQRERGAYLMGETPIRMIEHLQCRTPATSQRLEQLLESTLDHPARELMWGSPGALLAAWLLHRRDPDPRWVALFRRIAAKLLTQMVWSAPAGCWHWTQDLYGHRSDYLDAVHGFAGTAMALTLGRDLLDAEAWALWQERIAATIRRTAIVEDGGANWPALLTHPMRMLMQHCHGSPGFVTCLGDFPGTELDDLLAQAGEATWRAGPLRKGSNLCHGTAGNGFAFLKLHRRGDTQAPWLARARAFAMHAIAQFEADTRRHGQLRASLWTGDAGLAIYLDRCIREDASFPTLDVF